MTAIIRVSGVRKTYRNSATGPIDLIKGLLGRGDPLRPALDGIDFEIGRGEAVGVVGRNGSGKSTLLRLLAGTLQPSEGEIVLEGRLGSLLDLGAGIDPEYTGAENARVLGLLAGLSRSEVDARLDQVHAFSGLGEAFDRPVKSYSTGMVMRLGFSASVHGDPDVLLIDEALAVGDAFFQQRCLRRMRELRADGVTIVLVSHDPSAVISLCDRCLWLESGSVMLDGRSDAVIKAFLAARYTDGCELDAAGLGREDLVERPAGAILPAAPFASGAAVDRFGDGRARILGTELRDSSGARVNLVRPGDVVKVVISARAEAALDSLLIGLTLRNRLGDVVTATNTEMAGIRVPALAPGQEIDVVFQLTWPSLTSGPIALSPAIAEGNVAAHRMCDWVENALVLDCQNPHGLFGWLSLEGVEVSVGAPRGRAAVSMTAEPVDVAQDPHFAFALDSPLRREVDPSLITEDRKLFVSGWIFSLEDGEVEISAQVGGSEAGVCRSGSFREDVARVHADVPNAGTSGFGLLVKLPDEGGPTRMVITGALSDGRWRELVDMEIDLPPARAALARPDPISGRSAEYAAGGRAARVAFVSHGLNREGAPICLFELAGGLDPRRFDVECWSPAAGPLEGAWKDAGHRIHIHPVDLNQPTADDFDALVRRIAAMIALRKPDLIVANTLETFWAVHVASELGISSLWLVHESEAPSAYFHSRFRTAIAEEAVRAFAMAERVVFVSEATRTLFRDKLDAGHSPVIPNGLRIDRFPLTMKEEARREVRASLGIDTAASLILCAGTTCIRKGQLELVRALASIHKAGTAFHCVLLGVTEGDYLDRVRTAIVAGGLEEHVTLMKPVDDPRRYFAAADLVACPSYQESLPRVVQEGMAFAVPVVATDVFGIPELVRDGREGLLVRAGDVEGLAEAMTRILEDPVAAKRMGERGRSRVQAEFTAPLWVERYSAVFDDVLGRGVKASKG